MCTVLLIELCWISTNVQSSMENGNVLILLLFSYSTVKSQFDDGRSDPQIWSDIIIQIYNEI